jgi:hypothetical protein
MRKRVGDKRVGRSGLNVGDKNTKYFHYFARYRRNKKFIWEIKDEAGGIHTGQEALKEEANNLQGTN